MPKKKSRAASKLLGRKLGSYTKTLANQVFGLSRSCAKKKRLTSPEASPMKPSAFIVLRRIECCGFA